MHISMSVCIDKDVNVSSGILGDGNMVFLYLVYLSLFFNFFTV